MEDPKIKTKVYHSLSKPAWNVAGTKLGGKYKIARVPYILTDDKRTNEKNSKEAYDHANFISHCFNNSKEIIATTV